MTRLADSGRSRRLPIGISRQLVPGFFNEDPNLEGGDPGQVGGRSEAIAVLLLLALLTASCGDDSDPTATAAPAPITTTVPLASEPSDSPSPSRSIEPPATEQPVATPPPAGTAQASPAATFGAAEAGVAMVTIQDLPSFSFFLSTCMTSATDPDSFLLPDSFQIYGENETLGLTADWLSANGEDYFGTGSIGPIHDGEGGLVTFEPGDLSTTGAEVTGETVVNVLGPDVEGITDGATATITFSC